MEEEDASTKTHAHQRGIKQETRRKSSRKLEEGTSQAHQTEKRQETRRSFTKPLKKTFKKAAGRSISRCTRSQVAPKWTKKETMILLNEMACQDHELAKALPSIQRWKIVAEGCRRMNVNRSSNDCRRRWDSLLTERNKIREWESSKSFSELGSYWSLKSSKTKKFQLPASLDEDVFGAIEGVIEVQEALCGFKEPVQVSDDEVENDKDDVDSDANDDSDSNDDSDANDDSDSNDDSDANDDSDSNDDSAVSNDSDYASERTTTETESSDSNVRGDRTRAIKGPRKVSNETFDTEMMNDSLDAGADADADAGADVDADAGADGVADADTNGVAGAGADGGADAVAGVDAGIDAVAVAGADADAGVDAVAGAYAAAVAGADAGTNADAYSEKKEIGTTKLYSKEQEMANKLRENAKQIQAILKGEVPDNVGESQIDSSKPNSRESEVINRQAGELIKSFEVLVSNFDRFNNLINEGSCEGINFIKPRVI